MIVLPEFLSFYRFYEVDILAHGGPYLYILWMTSYEMPDIQLLLDNKIVSVNESVFDDELFYGRTMWENVIFFLNWLIDAVVSFHKFTVEFEMRPNICEGQMSLKPSISVPLNGLVIDWTISITKCIYCSSSFRIHRTHSTKEKPLI